MKEITFINRNKNRWDDFEKQLARPENPDVLADQYIQLTDDLSYARTFYPGSHIASYLNRLTLKTHQEIYKNKRESTSRIRTFFTQEIPLLNYELRKLYLISLIIFSLSILLGVVSALTDESFVRMILGDEYVNNTLNNIQKGDPLAVYGTMDESLMFLTITINNIRVAFITFLLGLLTPLGTSYIIFTNGVMVGSFITFFYQHNILGTSLLGVFIHGTLELSAIVIAGGAGILMGKGFLFPGTYSRLHAFTTAAKKGAKVMIALVPFFMVAGFFEGFLTRYYQSIPLVLNIIIIGSSLTVICWYFFIFPYIIHKKQTSQNHEKTN